MKNNLLTTAAIFGIFLLQSALPACTSPSSSSQPASTSADSIQLVGTWQLISGTTITKGVSEFTDYTKNSQMIKIINNTHFAFLKHDTNPAKDSSNHFDAGGGSYTLVGNTYTESLDFYSDHNWEAKKFTFTLSFNKDTLIQRGMEKNEKENIDREIIERYVRLK